MAKHRKAAKGGRAKHVRAQVPLRWRETRISTWREKADLTQQKVADEVAKLVPDAAGTRESFQRVEKGEQMPPVVYLEALVTVLGAPDLDTLLNYTPAEAEIIAQFKALPHAERERVMRIYRASLTEG